MLTILLRLVNDVSGEGSVVRKESKERSQKGLLRREPKHEFSLLCCYMSSWKTSSAKQAYADKAWLLKTACCMSLPAGP